MCALCYVFNLTNRSSPYCFTLSIILANWLSFDWCTCVFCYFYSPSLSRLKTFITSNKSSDIYRAWRWRSRCREFIKMNFFYIFHQHNTSFTNRLHTLNIPCLQVNRHWKLSKHSTQSDRSMIIKFSIGGKDWNFPLEARLEIIFFFLFVFSAAEERFFLSFQNACVSLSNFTSHLHDYSRLFLRLIRRIFSSEIFQLFHLNFLKF